jgi:predicted phosphoribosyltransferase
MPFGAVGEYYADFAPLSDQDVSAMSTNTGG